MTRLLLIGARTEVLKEAKKVGFEVILFEKEDRITNNQLDLADETYILNWEDHELAIIWAKTIHNNVKINFVLSFGERGVVTAAKIKAALGNEVDGINPSAVFISNNKALFREKLNNLNLSNVHYRGYQGLPKFAEVLNEFDFPFIVKPVAGTGSTDVHKVETKKELLDLYENENLRNKHIIVEEYLVGQELSIETISFDGNHEVIGFTKKDTTGAPNFIEVSHLMPFQLDPILAKKLESLTIKVLNAINHKTGPTHTEVILTKSGPKIVETHTRPGGDYITELIESSYNVNVYYETLSYLKEGKVRKRVNKVPVKYTFVKFFLFSEGFVKKIIRSKRLDINKSILSCNLQIKEGTQIKIPKNSKGRHGYFIITGESLEEISTVTKEVESSIEVHIE
ncbi:ATP-grasp domain-containing protein [Cytobacillus firmus]|uniref:ATP-grasp domain-containing protein n=1 Tax=Cytobacillus firmus TaxID=1399 RepID=UPI0018CD4DA7|nr:ATP-grasp domain-containing protein [Cytobacillus firmus]MBG9590193.1 hypothetical protein [Cytobacillus firmus]